MLDSFKLITHRFPGDISIYPISDVHLGAIEHCSAEWKEFCKKVAEKEDTYLILNGDLVNNSVRSAGFANPFDETLRPMEQKFKMVEYLKPIADKILCITTGNHELRTTKDSDQDITYDIASKLNIEDRYRKDIAYIKISLGGTTSRKSPDNIYTFAVTHGAGGGILTGATVNRNERFAAIIDNLDCLIVGHTHKGAVTKPTKLVIDTRHDKVLLRSYTVISSESWLNYGGYSAHKMLIPAEAAHPQRIDLAKGCCRMNKKIEVLW